jgi:septal ring-binding cell division protein DamX
MSLETPPTPPAAPDTPPPAPRACPRCGAGLTPDQEWCLNCGADVGARVAETPRWRVPILIVGLLLVAALGAVALALVELANDDQQVAQAPAQTAAPTPTPPPAPTGEQPAPGEAGATPGAQVPEASDSATAPGQSGDATPAPENEGDTNPSAGATPSPGASASPSPDSGAGSSGAIASWPAGKTAWTVILDSATSESAADAKANELSGQGTTVGVLHSDDYSSLNPGYWVVFSGQYDSQSAAQDAADSLKSQVPEAYARHVVPD